MARKRGGGIAHGEAGPVARRACFSSSTCWCRRVAVTCSVLRLAAGPGATGARTALADEGSSRPGSEAICVSSDDFWMARVSAARDSLSWPRRSSSADESADSSDAGADESVHPCSAAGCTAACSSLSCSPTRARSRSARNACGEARGEESCIPDAPTHATTASASVGRRMMERSGGVRVTSDLRPPQKRCAERSRGPPPQRVTLCAATFEGHRPPTRDLT